MSKSLALILLGALLTLPAVTAQVLPAHTLSVSIEDLPGNSTLNGTLMAIPFRVTAQVNGMSPCLSPSGSEYTFNLAATVLNSTGNETAAEVSPATATVRGPGSQPGTVTRTTAATLLIYPGAYVGDSLQAQVRVTATSTSVSPCTGGQATPSASDSEDVSATFLPPQGFGTPAAEAGQEMPALPAPLLLAGLAALVVAMRRK